MTTFVSKNALPLIRFIPVKNETGRQRAAQIADSFDRLLAAAVAANPEFTGADDADFDLVSFLEIEFLHNRRWQPYGQTIAPLRNLHDHSPLIYVVNRISIRASHLDQALRSLSGHRGQLRWSKLSAPGTIARRRGSRMKLDSVRALKAEVSEQILGPTLREAQAVKSFGLATGP